MQDHPKCPVLRWQLIFCPLHHGRSLLVRTVGIELKQYCQELDSWIPVVPFQLRAFLILWFNSSSHPCDTKCTQTYCACMIKLSEFWLWKFGWKPDSDKTLLPSAFVTETTRLKFAHTQKILAFFMVGVSLSEPIWGQCLPCFICDTKNT